MTRKTTATVMVVAALTSAACGSTRNPAASSSTTNPATTTVAPSPSAASTTTAPSVSTTTLAAVGQALPISVSSQLTSDQQDSSVLMPSSCQLSDGVVTAQGQVNGILPEVYIRYGDVVELYAYNTADNPPDGASDVQVLALESERPGTLAGGSSWTASAPIARGLPQPLRCFVAIQSTHAFMSAGSAGG